jgi:hypothetical protein
VVVDPLGKIEPGSGPAVRVINVPGQLSVVVGADQETEAAQLGALVLEMIPEGRNAQIVVDQGRTEFSVGTAVEVEAVEVGGVEGWEAGGFDGADWRVDDWVEVGQPLIRVSASRRNTCDSVSFAKLGLVISS